MTGRPIRCTACDATVRVYEIPVGTATWRIDPARYRCPDCRKPVTHATQLALDPDPEPVVFGPRDELRYEPAMVEIPL